MEIRLSSFEFLARFQPSSLTFSKQSVLRSLPLPGLSHAVLMRIRRRPRGGFAGIFDPRLPEARKAAALS